MQANVIDRCCEEIGKLDYSHGLAARLEQRWNSLTKPLGSLGRLEEIGSQYALIRNTLEPRIDRKAVYVFCADHGVVAEGVSLYPQSVTTEMMRNFVRGGAAINVLCQAHEAESVIVDVGAAGEKVEDVLDCRIADGTRNFAVEPAMTREEGLRAVEVGISLAEEGAQRYDIAGIGEMGIGNTTAAAALLAAFSGVGGMEVAGRGTGLSDEGVRHKAAVIDRALALHKPDPAKALDTLCALGGFEIAAMAGFILGAAAQRLPVMLDGFISCAGAVVARALCNEAMNSCMFSHVSAEQGHRRMLHFLGARPLLELDLRLGEGTGAVLGMHLLESSLRLLGEMATFESAGVSGADAL